jgi:cell division septation protein DedD
MRQGHVDRHAPNEAHGPHDDPDYGFEERPRRSGWRRVATIMVAFVAVFGFGAIVAYGYLSYADRHALAPAPLVAADTRPVRAKPENDGGLAIPHQNMAVFDAGQQSSPARAPRGAETLLPLPEAPLPKPTPSPAAQAVTVSARPDGAAAAPAQAAAVPGALQATPSVAADATQAAIGLPPAPRVAPLPPPPAPATAAAVRIASVTPTAPAAPQQGSASGFRIQVGAMRTEAEARTAWEQVQRRHPDILGRLAPSFARVELGDRGSFYRVQAGPLPSRDAARGACERLSKAGTVCFVVPPA